MKVSIRRFEAGDIPDKVRWINDPRNNAFLHYELPLEVEKTQIWFEKNRDRTDRYDAVIEADGKPVGLIGLLSIDRKNQKAEYYVTIGESAYLGRGVANRASKLILDYAFETLGLNRVYLYTETENIAAVKSYEKIGFRREGVLKKDLFSRGRYVDRYVYGITKEDYTHRVDTPIQNLSEFDGNRVYIKREDLIPFSFGGNKARKARLFFEEIDRGDYDCVVTYGSGSSNHCRVVANMAAARKMACHIISPEEASGRTYNSRMMEAFGAEITVCPVSRVHDTIENKLADLRKAGHNPFFIAGGGHGNTGTQAYVDCYEEIRRFERENQVHFDYIFHASGTGTTQAGLVCGQLINRDDNRRIIGISIARKNPRGRDVVLDCIRDYLEAQKVCAGEAQMQETTIFLDDYTGDGYGRHAAEVENVIAAVMTQYGIPLDATYTGKAFAGMLDYVKRGDITGKNILFIHTGGTPLFFDHIEGKNL